MLHGTILFGGYLAVVGVKVLPVFTCTLAILNKGNISMILSKYAIPSLTVSVADIKNPMWMHFVDASYDKLCSYTYFYAYFIVHISLCVLYCYCGVINNNNSVELSASSSIKQLSQHYYFSVKLSFHLYMWTANALFTCLCNVR